MMTKRCEVCTGDGREGVFSKYGYEFLRCVECGHISVQLDVPNVVLYETYERHFFSDGAYVDYVKDKEVLQKNFSRFIGILRQYSPAGLLLEVGCAYGFFLELARQHWQVQGVDINREATSFAREQLGLDVVCGDLLDLPMRDDTYDVVAMWDTIEHMRNPSDYVAKVARILKPGGILALTTGDIGSFIATVRGKRWRLYYPPFHLHYFSRRTIARLLGRFGLKVVKNSAVGFYRSIDMMLYRMFFDRKPPISRSIYLVTKRAGLARQALYVNLFDIMLVIAKKA